MATTARPSASYLLIRNLVVALAIGGGLFALFDLINNHTLVLPGVNPTDLLLLEAGAVVLVAYLLARALTSAAGAYMRRHGEVSRSHVVRIFLNLLIAVGAVLALFKIAGVSLETIFLGSALAGIVLGLAAQTVLANVFAGLLLVVADPFRPGDRISLLSSSYGAIAPSYAHEMMFPNYEGTVEDLGLIYTTLREDAGGIVKVPNTVVLGALVRRPVRGGSRTQRVRMTFPQTVPVATVESALTDLRATIQDGSEPPSRLVLKVVDIAASTWDGVVTVWTSSLDTTSLRDRILRAVLAKVAPARASA
jgi:small-conductance mechanosensitive channel